MCVKYVARKMCWIGDKLGDLSRKCFFKWSYLLSAQANFKFSRLSRFSRSFEHPINLFNLNFYNINLFWESSSRKFHEFYWCVYCSLLQLRFHKHTKLKIHTHKTQTMLRKYLSPFAIIFFPIMCCNTVL